MAASLDWSLSHAAGLGGARVAPLLHEPLGIVLVDEIAGGVPKLLEVAVDAALDDLFLEDAVEPLGGDVGLRLFALHAAWLAARCSR